MKCGVRVAIGVAGGYFLGRTKKMKLALMLGGMAAGRRAGGPGELLARGSKLVGASPELSRLTDEVRDRLFEAGKSAALAVAARQVEALTDRVGKGVESLGDLGSGTRKSRPRQAERDASEDHDDYEDYPEDAEEGSDLDAEQDQSVDAGDADSGDEAEEPEPAAPRRRANASAGRGREGGTATAVKRAPSGAAEGRRTTGKTADGKARSSTRTRRSSTDG